MGEKKKPKKKVKQAAPPPSQKKIIDYDDSDPFSCIAAGARERGHTPGTADQVHSCYMHRSGSELKALAKKDKDGVMRALWGLWSKAHGGKSHDYTMARWAAEALNGLGDSSLLEREKNFLKGVQK